jgi:putative transposase
VTRHGPGTLTAEHSTNQRDVFTKICQDFGATSAECNGEDDYIHHIHLLVRYPPNVLITALMSSPQRNLRPSIPPVTARYGQDL